MLYKLLTPELTMIRQAFQDFNLDIWLVGGCVRSLIIGDKINDIDLATNASPDEQIEIYKAAGLKYILTGLQHGTITVIVDDEQYEITSFRTESDHDGRRATVAYTRDLHTDLERRDFAFNALALSFDNELIDLFNGVDDLRKGLVRFVGNANDRITEDFLRILRFYRFFGRYGKTFDRDTIAAIRMNAEGLLKISGERIWSEMAKILVGNKVYEILQNMYDNDILKNIGVRDIEGYYTIDSKNPITVLATILTEDQLDSVNDRWKFSTDEFKLLRFLVVNKANRFTNFDLVSLLANNTPREWLIEYAYLNLKDPTFIANFNVPLFPINGNDMLALGYRGVEIGKAMKFMKNEWIHSWFSLNKENLLDLLNEGSRTF